MAGTAIPPFTIEGMRDFVLARISYGSTMDDANYRDRVAEECRMALYELEMAGKWSFLHAVATNVTVSAGSSTATGITDYSRPVSTFISHGQDTAVIATPEEAEEVNRRSAVDGLVSASKITAVTLQPKDDGKLYATGYPDNTVSGISSGVFTYLKKLTPVLDTTAVPMPPTFFDAWYMLSMLRIHENLQKDPVRAKWFQERYQAKLSRLLETDQLTEKTEEFRAGTTALELTQYDVDGSGNAISHQLLPELDLMSPGKASLEVCRRATKVAFRITWNSFNWNFRIRTGSVSPGASSFSLPSDFDPSYKDTSFYSPDGHHPLVTPEEFARRATSPTTAAGVTKRVSPITITWSAGTATAKLLEAPSGTPAGAITYFYRALAPSLDMSTAPPDMPDDFYDAWRVRARWLAVEMHGKDIPQGAAQNAKEQWERVYNDLKDSVHVFTLGEDTDSVYNNDTPDGLAEQVYEKIASLGISARRGSCRNAVTRAFRTVWYLKPWAHRKKIDTLSVDASGTTPLPADFADFMPGARFGDPTKTEIAIVDPADWDREKARIGSPGSPTTPSIATVVPLPTPTDPHPQEIEWSLLTYPTVAITATIPYLTTPVAITDTKIVTVPSDFRELWWLLSIYYASEEHPKLDANIVQQTKQAYEEVRDVVLGKRTTVPADTTLTDNTLDDVTAQVRSFLQRNNLEIDFNQLGRNVQRAFNDVWMANPWRFRVQSVTNIDVSAGPFILPARFASILPNTPIKTASGKELPYLPPDQYAARSNDSTSATNAVCTIMYNEDITNGSSWQVLATPASGVTGTYTMYYLSTPSTLAGSDLAPLPEEFKQLWALRAEMRALESYPARTDLMEQRTARWDAFLASPEKYDTIASDSGIADSSGYTLDEITARIMAAIKPFGQPIRSVVRQAARDAIDEIWNMAEWSWRQRTATVSLSSGDTSKALASDFHSLVTDNVPYLTYNQSDNASVYVTDLPTLQAKRNDNQSAQQSIPDSVAIAWDSATNAYTAEFEPPADGAYTFNYRYFAKKPSFDDTGTYDAEVPENMKIPWDTLTWKYALERTTLNRGSLYVLESARDRWSQVRSGLGARNRVTPGKNPIDENGDIAMLMDAMI